MGASGGVLLVVRTKEFEPSIVCVRTISTTPPEKERYFLTEQTNTPCVARRRSHSVLCKLWLFRGFGYDLCSEFFFRLPFGSYA
jgi:hypothetical protein